MTTYWVDDDTGLDADDGLSEADAFKTIQKALDTVAAGDLVNVKNTNFYDENLTVITSAAVGTKVVLEGYATTPGDGGRVTIQPSGGVDVVDPAATQLYLWSYFTFDGVNVSAGCFESTSSNFHAFFECVFENAGNRAVNVNDNYLFIRCVFRNCTGGVLTDLDAMFFGCVFHGNGSNVTNLNGDSLYYKCVFYDGPVSQFMRTGHSRIIACLFDGEAKSGIGGYSATSSAPTDEVVIDNIFYDLATALGIPSIAGQQVAKTILYNHFHSNTSDYNQTVEPLSWMEDFDSSGDLLFVDETNRDYTLGAASPAKDTAIQPWFGP
jgi:hypothetical protein